MKITEIRLRRVNTDGKLKAIVSVTFDESFVVHDIKVIEGKNGYFVAMPSRSMGEGTFRDIVHPIQTEMREYISKEILSYYDENPEVNSKDL